MCVRSPLRSWWKEIIVLVGMIPHAVGDCAHAQDGGTARLVEKATDPTALANEVASAYQTRVVAERIRVQVSTGGSSSETKSVILRSEPASAKRGTPRRLYLELGRFKCWLIGNECTVINGAEPTKFYQGKLEDPVTLEAWSRQLRFVALPQVSWVLTGDSALPLGAAAGNVAWTNAELKNKGNVELRGTGKWGDARLVFDGNTYQAQRFSAVVARDISIDLIIDALGNAPWSGWDPPLSGRGRVESLDQLQPDSAPNSDVQRFPLLACFTSELEGISLPASADADPLYIVCVRYGKDGQVGNTARERAEMLIKGVQKHLADSRGANPERAVLVLGFLPVGSPLEHLREWGRGWETALRGGAASVVWTTSSWALVADPAAESEVVLHVVGSERRRLAEIALTKEQDESTIVKALERVRVFEPVPAREKKTTEK